MNKGLFLSNLKQISSRISLLFFIFCIFLTKNIHGQKITNVNVYISPIVNSVIKNELTLFFKEINKVANFKYDVKSNVEFNNEGFLFTKLELNKASKKYSNPEAFSVIGDGKSLKFNASNEKGFKRALIYYLDKLGFKYYAPMPEWHIKPSIIDLYLKLNEFSSPSFYTRNFFVAYGFGPKSPALNDFNYWKTMNNMGGQMEIEIQHIYYDIVLRNKLKFELNKDFLNGKTQEEKFNQIPSFNLSNSEAVNVILKDSRERILEKISQNGFCDMISMEPSDGNGLEKASAEIKSKIGNPSNQAFWLANKVAEYNQKEFPNVLYGILGYNEHILPPTTPIHKNVFVMVTNGFNYSEQSVPEILKLYKEKTKRIGIYEYLDGYVWTKDIPGLAVNSDYKKTEKTVLDAYQNGVRYFDGEASSGWINRLLGNYILAKLLWDVKLNVPQTKENLYNDCFGNVKYLIAPIFDRWAENKLQIINKYELFDWYNTLLKAKTIADNQNLKIRIEDIINYVKYLILYNKILEEKSVENVGNMISFARQNNERPVFSTFQCLNVLPALKGFPMMGFWESKDLSKDSVEKTPTPLAISNTKANFNFFENNKDFKLEMLDNTKYSFENNVTFNVTEIRNSKPYFVLNAHKYGNSVSKQPCIVNIIVNGKTLLKYKILNSKRGENDTFYFPSQILSKSFNISINDEGRLYNIQFSKNINVNITLNKNKSIVTSSATGLCEFILTVPSNINKFYVLRESELMLSSADNKVIDLRIPNAETNIVECSLPTHKIWRIYNQNGFLSIY